MFKNLTVFKFDPLAESNTKIINILLNLDNEAEQMLAEHQPSDPVAQQVMRFGYAHIDQLTLDLATGGDVPIFHRFLPLTMVVRQRAIDAGAVELAVRRQVAKVQAEQSRIVGKKEKAAIKDEILFEMIPKAPIKEKRIKGYVTGAGFILVDAVGKAAEDYVSFLREAVGGLAALQLDLDLQNEPCTEELIHDYVVKSIEREHFGIPGENDEAMYKFADTFAFIIGEEQITVKNCTDTTMCGDFFSRVKQGQVVWCEFDNKDVNFRLMADLSLKALNFIDLGFQDKASPEASVAQHRFEIKTYRDLVDSIVAEIHAAQDDEQDDE